jgi:hypothetical protein
MNEYQAWLEGVAMETQANVKSMGGDSKAHFSARPPASFTGLSVVISSDRFRDARSGA